MTADQLSIEPSTEMLSKLANDTIEYRIWVAMALAGIGRMTNEHTIALHNLTTNGCSMAPMHRDLERRVVSLETGKMFDHTMSTKGVSLFRGIIDIRNYTPREIAFFLLMMAIIAVNVVNKVDIGKLRALVDTTAAAPTSLVTAPTP